MCFFCNCVNNLEATTYYICLRLHFHYAFSAIQIAVMNLACPRLWLRIMLSLNVQGYKCYTCVTVSIMCYFDQLFCYF